MLSVHVTIQHIGIDVFLETDVAFQTTFLGGCGFLSLWHV